MNTEKRKLIADKIRQYPNHSNKQIRDMLRRQGVRQSEVGEVRATIGKIIVGAAEELAPKMPRIRPTDLSEFRKAHDLPQKIRDRLSAITGSRYFTEEDFRQHCEISVQNWRRNADLPEFAPHKFKLDGVTYWAGIETIKEMKRITGRA